MHKEILNTDIIVKHKNRDTLDNQKHNLYKITDTVDSLKYKKSIYFDKMNNKYIARAYFYIGQYETEEEAENAFARTIYDLEKV